MTAYLHPSLNTFGSTCSIIFVTTFVCIFTLHVTKKFSFNILKTISLKIEKKTSIEAQNEGHTQNKWKPLSLADRRKRIQKRCSIGSERFPIQLHLKELYSECYPHTLAPNLEMTAVNYAGKTSGRCSIISFCIVVVACSFLVARVITRRKAFEFNRPEVRLKEKHI